MEGSLINPALTTTLTVLIKNLIKQNGHSTTLFIAITYVYVVIINPLHYNSQIYLTIYTRTGMYVLSSTITKTKKE